MPYKDPQKEKEYYKNYYRRNKAKKAAQGKKRYIEKREEILKQKREYSLKNKEIIKERGKKYRESSQGKTTYNAYMKKWRKDNSEKLNESARLARLTPLGRAKFLYSAAKARAKKRNINFSISLERILKPIKEGKCEITKFKFDLLPSKEFRRNPWSPSIDRINPKGSYEDNNVQVVCWEYNKAKNVWKLEEFKFMLRGAVSKNILDQVCEIKKVLKKRATSLISDTKARAKKKQITYDKKIEKLIEKKIINGFCEKTNIAFKVKDSFGRRKCPWTPSIDRIDNNKGYIVDNIQIVCWAYNQAKGQLSQEDFDKFLYAAARGHKII